MKFNALQCASNLVYCSKGHIMDMLKIIRKEIEKSEKNGISRYQISKTTGITEGQLHRIMVKNQSLYCETAQKLLSYFGYEIRKKKGR